VDALAKARKELLSPGKKDAPLEPFLWEDAGDKLIKDRVRQLAGAAKGAAVEETTLDNLLATVPEEDRPEFDKLAGGCTSAPPAAQPPSWPPRPTTCAGWGGKLRPASGTPSGSGCGGPRPPSCSCVR
jgi:hypothetical protein